MSNFTSTDGTQIHREDPDVIALPLLSPLFNQPAALEVEETGTAFAVGSSHRSGPFEARHKTKVVLEWPT